MRHYIMDTTDDVVKYHIDHFVDDKTGHAVCRLSYSNSEHWNSFIKGETILTVTNDGNRFQVKWEEKPKKNYLDYSQMRELQLVLSFIQKWDPVDNHVMALQHNELLRF